MAWRYFTSVLLFTLFLLQVSSQQMDQVTFVEGDTVMIYCNASFVGVPNQFLRMKTVQLLRVEEQTNIEMAFVQQKDGTSEALTDTVDSSTFRGWTFELTPLVELQQQLSEIPNNRDSLKIVATKNSARCSDSAVFKCIVGYVGDNSITASSEKDSNYTGRGKISIPTMTIIPTGNNNNNEYVENTTLTVKCSADGPENYEFRWHERCGFGNSLIPPPWTAWPSNEIQPNTSSPLLSVNGQPNDCNTYNHRQEIIFTAQLVDSGCEIRCQFGMVSALNVFVSESSANMSIMVSQKEGDGGDSTGAASSSASGDSLAIGLGVGLSLLVIIIVVILIYVFCCRKRKSDDKYKGSGQDNPDANNLGSNAPPPVFYSKPNKPPKSERNDVPVDGMTNVALDTSYDSKDSANRPPPHYANAPDDNGPPHYNHGDNDTSRRHPSYEDGQQNRGYSESPDPTADGGRRYRRRDRNSRGGSHNSSRDYDDEPRSVDYNPQPRSMDYDADPRPYAPRHNNFTVELNNDYGDPSLGTAI